MLNIKNLLKAQNKEVCFLFKHGDYMSVSGILLSVVDDDIILECKDNSRYGNADVYESEAHIPINEVASWFLIKNSAYSN